VTAPAFDPHAPVEGSAFPLPVKLMASLMVAGVVAGGVDVAASLAAAQWSTAAAVLMAGAGVLLLLCLWWIWRSRTALDGERIRQTWMWPKQVAWSEVVQARVIAIPGLEWLIAPRLVVRARGGVVMIFHVADAKVLRTLAVRLTGAALT
jgi:hypothetical protein